MTNDIASELAFGYQVYLLPNPPETRTPDFILVKKGVYRIYDLKTVFGKSSVESSLLDSIGQCNSILVNLLIESMIEYATLHVPAEAIILYNSVEPWRGFGNIVALTEDEAGVKLVDVEQISLMNNGNMLYISGVDAGTDINVYDVAGKMVGSAKANTGTTVIDTSL